MKTYTLKLKTIGRYTTEIELSDEPTPEEIETAVRKAWDRAAFDFEDFEQWPDGEPVPTAKVQDAAWIEVDGHRWATDGSCAIRDDCPLPKVYPGWDGWIDGTVRTKPTPAGLRIVLMTRNFRVGTAFLVSRFKPIVEAGTLFRGGGPLDPVFVKRDGETIAVLMPYRADSASESGPHGQTLIAVPA